MGLLTHGDLLRLSTAAAAAKLRSNLKVFEDGLTAELLRALDVEQIQDLVALAVSPTTERPKTWNGIPVIVLRKPGGTHLHHNRLIAQQSASNKLYLSALRTAGYAAAP